MYDQEIIQDKKSLKDKESFKDQGGFKDKASLKIKKSFQDQVQVAKRQVRESYTNKKAVTRKEDRHKILTRQKRHKV